MNIDLSDYVAGGYFVVKYSDHGFWKSKLLPERVISLSGCIGKKLDIVWGWDIERYEQEVIDFGISADKHDAFHTWCSGRNPGALYSLELARESVTRFLPDISDYLIVGIALPKVLVPSFLSDHKQTVYYANEQVYKDDLYSVNYMLTEGTSLPTGGNPLGFEVLSYFNYHLACSWLCSGIEKDMHELFGIRPNSYGLIDSYEDAKKVYEWIAEDEMQGTRGEPEPYYPWLIVQYPL